MLSLSKTLTPSFFPIEDIDVSVDIRLDRPQRREHFVLAADRPADAKVVPENQFGRIPL